MKTLVVYASRESGNTRKLAEAIAAKLGDGCVLAAAVDAPEPDGFDFVALGFGVYRGWPDGDMRGYMKRCRGKDVGVFMTLGAWPDSEHAANCMGRAEGLLDHCRVRVKFVCQGAYTPDFLARLKSLPATSPHGWNPERAERVASAMKHPDEADLNEAGMRFALAVEKLGHAAAKAEKPVKKALLLAVFGSTVPTAGLAYETMAAELRKTHPDTPVFIAYTSGVVRAKSGYRVPSVSGVLKQLMLEGFTAVDVVAGFLAPGEEYGRLRNDLAAFADVMNLRITRPPLSDLMTLRAFLPMVAASVPSERKPGESVIFMGHGNADGRADFQYMAAAAELTRLDPAFHLACVEGNLPFDELLPRLHGGRVWLVPLMLVAGDHARNDMAGAEPDSWRSRLTKAGHDCGCVLHGLGENTAIAKFFAASAAVEL